MQLRAGWLPLKGCSPNLGEERALEVNFGQFIGSRQEETRRAPLFTKVGLVVNEGLFPSQGMFRLITKYNQLVIAMDS